MKLFLTFTLLTFFCLVGAKAQELKKNAMITQGDVFAVQVERIDENEDQKTFTKTKEIEFWAISIRPETNSGELLVITQAAVPGQRYPLIRKYPLKNIQDLGGGKFFATALHEGVLTATDPRKLIIEMASPVVISSVY